MTPEKQNEIALFCYTAVSRMFATFHNPKMRGHKFTWDGFPEMMESFCRSMYPYNVTAETQEEFDHAARTGRQIAEQLVKWMRE